MPLMVKSVICVIWCRVLALCGYSHLPVMCVVTMIVAQWKCSNSIYETLIPTKISILGL